MSTGTSSPSHRYPEHPWVTSVLMALRNHLENDVYGLAERLTNMARDYDAMQERNRTLQTENADLRREHSDLVGLIPYARHQMDCDWLTKAPPRDCTCGYAAALKKADRP